MPSYPHVLNEEQMADLLELAGYKIEYEVDSLLQRVKVLVTTGDGVSFWEENVGVEELILPRVFKLYLNIQGMKDNTDET